MPFGPLHRLKMIDDELCYHLPSLTQITGGCIIDHCRSVSRRVGVSYDDRAGRKRVSLLREKCKRLLVSTSEQIASSLLEIFSTITLVDEESYSLPSWPGALLPMSAMVLAYAIVVYCAGTLL